MTRLLWILLALGLVAGVGACSKVAPNKKPPNSPYPRSYPYEPPDLYNPTYPPDGEARTQMRREGMRNEGVLFYR